MRAIVTVLLFGLSTPPAIGQQTIYRWLNPETGQYITTPTLPPYPVKGKRPGGNLSGIDLVNVDLDVSAPAVKAAIEKREAGKAEERSKEVEKHRKEQEREDLKLRREQVEKEFQERRRQESEEAHKAQCPGSLTFGIKLGMNQDQVRFCLQDINDGQPNKINTTTSVAGLREQWIYRIDSSESWYLYFSNGRLTSIQQ